MSQDNDSPDKLIHRYFDDSLSEADEAELIDSLDSSPEARKQFVEEALLDTDLRDVMREADIRLFIGNAELESTTQDAGQPAAFRFYSKTMRGALAAAILVATAVAIYQAGTRRAGTEAEAVAERWATKKVESPGVVSVGTLVQQIDCRWAKAAAPWRNGDPLPPNTVLSLTSGAAEVALENGVRLLLAGPCQIQLISEMRGKIFRGSLTATVPNAAHGYTLVTPSSQVIDLGTEFGITVDSSGESEVHVFQGEVISRWYGSDGEVEGRSLRLREKDAARYGLDKSKTALITADETRFVRDLAPRLPLEQLPPLPVRDELALWLAADHMIDTDESGGVESWSDLLCDSSQAFQVAIQLDPKARPQLVPDAINGMPAVRFDGVDDFLVTTPLETTDNQTICVALRLSNAQPARGQIINYNGPPHRILKFPSKPGVLQINARRFDDGTFRFAGLVHTGKSKTTWATDGHVRATYAPDDKTLAAPIFLCYRYDTESNEASLHINGKLAELRTAPWPAGLTSRKVIGRHTYDKKRHLNADIAEVLVYNQALPDDQLAQVTEYLTRRYDNTATKTAESREVRLP